MFGLPRLRWALLVALICYPCMTAGCITERIGKKSSLGEETRIFSGDKVYNFSALGSRYNIDPLMEGDVVLRVNEDLDEVYDPFAKYSAQTYYGDKGLITRHYYLQPGRGQAIADLLVGHVQGLRLYEGAGGGIVDIAKVNEIFKGPITEKNRMGTHDDYDEVLVITNAISDSRPSSVGATPNTKEFIGFAHATGIVSDLMVVTAKSPEKLLEIDSFLTSLLTELPMIEIKVRVVEVGVSDLFEWGGENIITYLTSSPNAFLKEWFNFYHTESYVKAGGASGFQGTLFNAFGIHDKMQLDATFELLQRVTDADILTAPTMTVQNGYRAIIQTGDKVPLQTITSTPTAAWYSYTYTQTGVTLSIVPYLLPGDLIEIHLSTEVRAVTGEETFQTSIGALTQPVISKRAVSTRLRIKEGQAFALGGLMSTREFQSVSKLPLLGDIPILGWLFKSKSVQKEQSQIIFYIEPHVVTREQGWMKKEDE